MESPQAPKPN
jgi:hypothetical protein